MLRGIERRTIFADDRDRDDFLRRLSELVPELGFRCFAWALMPNHVHLVLRSNQAPVSRLMARLGTGYARYFNARHDRVGHLFQNRFRSRRALDDVDLMGLALYAIRNPLAGGLVRDVLALEDFPWCGLGSLLGRRQARPFEAVAESLALFDPDPERARRRLRDWLGSGGGPDVCAAPAALRTAPAKPERRDFESLLRETCSARGLSVEDLLSRRRTPRIAAARADVATRAAAELGLGGSEIARRLGLSSAAVSLMLVRRRQTS